MVSVTTNLGNKKIFENESIVVWDFVLQPGQKTPMHRHENDYLWYVLQGAPLECKDIYGNDLGVVPAVTNAVFHLKIEGDNIEVLNGPGKGETMPAIHTAKNISNEIYREIIIEFK